MNQSPEELASELETLGDQLDGADLFTVFSILADEFSYETVGDFLTSRVAGEIISATQSNPVNTMGILTRMSELDEKLAEL